MLNTPAITPGREIIIKPQDRPASTCRQLYARCRYPAVKEGWNIEWIRGDQRRRLYGREFDGLVTQETCFDRANIPGQIRLDPGRVGEAIAANKIERCSAGCASCFEARRMGTSCIDFTRRG